MITIFWNLAAVQFNLGDFRIEGFIEGDAINIVPEADLTSMRAGGDGSHVVASRNNNKIHTLTLQLNRGTAGYKQITGALDDQMQEFDDGSAISVLPMSVVDTFSGEKITEAQVIFRRDADSTWGTEAPTATITAWLPSPQKTRAPNVVTTT